MKLLVVSADYSNWMYKSLYDEQQALFNYLKKQNHKIYVFGPGQKHCTSLNVDIFLKKKKYQTTILMELFFLSLREGFMME